MDRAIDTTGVPRIIEAAAGALKRGGELALVGASSERSISLDVMSILSGQVIRGVTEGDADPQRFIPFLVDEFLSGAFPIDRLTGCYPFERINDAVADGLSGRTIKPIIEFR